MMIMMMMMMMTMSRSGYSNVNMSQSNTNSNEEDIDNDEVRPSVFPPLGCITIDTKKSIGNVRKRVSSLVDGPFDRAALAKSVLASRSLLNRNNDIVRLLDGLRVPFTTALDDGFRAIENRERNLSPAGISGSKDNKPIAGSGYPIIGFKEDRFNAHGGTPTRQTSSVSAAVRSDSINDRTISDGQQELFAKRRTQTSTDRSGSLTKSSMVQIADVIPENVNASASPTDMRVEAPKTLEDAGNPQETPAEESEERASLSQPDNQNRRPAQHGCRLSAELLKTEMRKEEEKEVIMQGGRVSGGSQKPKSSSSTREMKTPSAPVTLWANTASNAGAQVTEDINPATSTLADPPRKGQLTPCNINELLQKFI